MVRVDLQPAAVGSIISSLAGATLQGVDYTGAGLNHADLLQRHGLARPYYPGAGHQIPNGFTVAENEANHKTLREMLTSANAPQSWYAARCGPAVEEIEQEMGLAKRMKA